MSLPETLHFERLRDHLTTLCFYKVVGKRPPKKGEYYVSGADPMACRAPNDLKTTFIIVEPTHLAKHVTRIERGDPVRIGR